MNKEDFKSKYLYLLAEFENYKKRTAKEKEILRKETEKRVLLPFLTIADYLSLANKIIEKTDNIDTIKHGIHMIAQEFDKTLNNLNVNKIKTIGEKFDYNLHEAVQYEASDDITEGYIKDEIKSGYKKGEDVLIAPKVIVSSGVEK